MTIEIHQPELEALIRQRMETGRFSSIEDVLLQALHSSEQSESSREASPRRKNLAQFLMESPLPGSGLELKRLKDSPRAVEL